MSNCIRHSGPHWVDKPALLLLLFASVCRPLHAQNVYTPYRITTVAGHVSAGSADGTGGAAQFDAPCGVAVDASGNVFVADAANCTIRKITPAGVVTTFAGSADVIGTADGTGSNARFNHPVGVASDGSGNIYVSDSGNNTIRKISSAGVVTTLAGSAGVVGSADGTGLSARFSGPNGIAIDSSGNLFVADGENFTIRRITAAGVVTTIAGTPGVSGNADGAGAAAQFAYPVGIAVDASDNVYVADFANSNVRKITAAGVVTTIAVPGVSYTPFSTGFPATHYYASNPWGVAIEASGNLVVTEYTLDVVQQITPGGVISTVAGSYGSPLLLGPIGGSSDGIGSAASFTKPTGVAIDTSGDIFVADYGNNTVRKIASGGVVTTLAGTLSSGGSSDGLATAASFKGPGGIAIDASGDLFVADTQNNAIRKITPTGSVSTYAGTAGVVGSSDGTGPAAQFSRPGGIAADGAGNIFVADSGNNVIRRIAPGGVVTTLAGTAGVYGWADGMGSAAQFNAADGIATDSSGNVYVADGGNNTIRKITPAGSVTTLAGMPAGQNGVIEGPAGAAARFFTPAAVAVDASGNVYVSDLYNHEIRKVTPAGLTTTLAGSPSGIGSVDGTGAAAGFFAPQGVAVDGNGNVYVVDSFANTIRRVTPGGVVTTLAGSTQSAGSADGTGSGALFSDPNGIAADSAGNIYVADTGNNAIRFGVLAGNPWLSNLSARALVQGGQNLLVAGFVTTGPNNKSVLIRGDGPALAIFGISNFLSDPQLTLLNSAGSTLATAISWNSGLVPIFAQLGAFSLAAESHDTALLETLPPGAYTAQVGSSTSNKGVAIAEIYDADAGAPTNRLINISARALVGTVTNVLIGGFVIGGTADETLLIRGDGPALAAFGLTGTLGTPVLTVLNAAGAPIATNTGWGSPCTLGSGAVTSGPGATTVEAATPSVFTKVGAFSLVSGSADSAMVITLPPGIYTAQVSGAAGGTGIGLVEIYEVP